MVVAFTAGAKASKCSVAFRDLPVDARDLRRGLIPGLAHEIRRELAKNSAPSRAGGMVIDPLCGRGARERSRSEFA